ncbi:MAG: hypothetical protein WCK51_08085 [Armatimonadota bacterium]
MRIALAALLCLALVGCGGSTSQISNNSSVVGKWILDLGASELPPPVPPTVEFRADGTYTQRFSDSEFDSTYEFKEGILTTEAGIGLDLKKQFVPQNDNAGTLQLTEVGPPPSSVYFWRSIN